MSINCSALFKDVAVEVGRGTGNEKLNSGFIRAVNRSLDELSITADLATRHSHIEATSDTISTLDAEYEGALYSGVVYWLIRMGFRPSDPKIATIVYNDTERRWQEGKDHYVTMTNISDPQNDTTESVVGLGYLGDT